jgi:dihydropteroate synthase
MAKVGTWLAILPRLDHRSAVMGVLNVTPDSFSDGGAHRTPEDAAEAAFRMLAAGADLIDVGGESTRPGSDPVPVELELSRVLPVIRILAQAGIDGISIDTTKAEVARQAILAGARVVNDISGMNFDPQMRRVVAEAQVPVILMHTKGPPKTMQSGSLEYPGGVVAAVSEALVGLAEAAQAAGIAKEAIMLDPGIGFGKSVDDNCALLAGLPGLRTLGYPLLVGPSRKSFLGAITGKPVEDRLHATAAAVALAVAGGANVVRVHDVGPMLDVVRVAERVARGPAS